MKKLKYLAAIVSLITIGSVNAQVVNQATTAQSHPLIGLWRIDLAKGCYEEYTMRADGTKSSESGEERNESIFEILPAPSELGFYRWVDKITKGNGKIDCSGSTTQLGHVAVNYIRLHSSRNKFLLCEKEEMSSCFAEFYRK